MSHVTMYSSRTKISVSALDLNVTKITTTRRHNFGKSEHVSRITIPLALARLPGCLR